MNLGIFQSLKFRILMEKKILSISLKLNFTPNTLGCHGLTEASYVANSGQLAVLGNVHKTIFLTKQSCINNPLVNLHKLLCSGASLVVEGSLGGLQVLDLTPEGQYHQRILSLGKDPLTADRRSDLLNSLSAGLYTLGTTEVAANERQAFNFKLIRTLKPSGETQGKNVVKQKAVASSVSRPLSRIFLMILTVSLTVHNLAQP